MILTFILSAMSVKCTMTSLSSSSPPQVSNSRCNGPVYIRFVCNRSLKPLLLCRVVVTKSPQATRVAGGLFFSIFKQSWQQKRYHEGQKGTLRCCRAQLENGSIQVNTQIHKRGHLMAIIFKPERNYLKTVPS